MGIESLIKHVCDSVYAVSNELRTGFLESVYQNALCIELKSKGIKCEQEVPITVTYKGAAVGFFRADIIVEDSLILEIKVVDEIIKAHEYQLVNYLTASGIDNGLLINFKGPKIDIRRKYRVFNRGIQDSEAMEKFNL